VVKAAAQEKERNDCTAKKKAARVKVEERSMHWEIEHKKLMEEGVPKSHLSKKTDIELESKSSKSENEED